MTWARKSISMFEDLAALNERPAPFSVYTADILWTDPHISARMLDFHLDAEGDLASRRAASIEGIVDWMDRKVGFEGKAVCDLGCGPGLYAALMARRGAWVTGWIFLRALSNTHVERRGKRGCP